MAKVKTTTSSEHSRKIRPALTPESEENQMMSLAVDLAKKQLLDGTASSQVITHFLKLASSKEKREAEMLESQIELLKAKTKALESAQRGEELFVNALNAMKSYTGHGDSDEY